VHIEIEVLVNGELDETARFFDATEFNQFLSDIEDEAKDHGYVTEVWATYHDHGPPKDGEKCQCPRPSKSRIIRTFNNR